MFSRESIVVWHFRSFASKQARIRAWAAWPPGAAEKVVRLTSPRATRRWLEDQGPPSGISPAGKAEPPGAASRA